MRKHHHLLRSFLCIGLAMLFSCCSPEEMYQTDKNSIPAFRQNTANLFDQTGMLYEQIYQDYLLAHIDSVYSTDRVIAEVEKIVAVSSAYYQGLETYSPVDIAVIQDIVFNRNISLEDYIQNATLTPVAQQLFVELTDSLIDNTNSELYNTLVDFESKVIKDSRLSSSDKEILLNCCSIMRYSIDSGGDKDWNDDNNAIIKAALTGMEENSSKAIIMAVVVRVAGSRQ